MFPELVEAPRIRVRSRRFRSAEFGGGDQQECAKSGKVANRKPTRGATEAPRRIRGIEISFHCSSCGRRMEELTDDELCVICNEVCTSSRPIAPNTRSLCFDELRAPLW
jgi:hypothetical protein